MGVFLIKVNESILNVLSNEIVILVLLINININGEIIFMLSVILISIISLGI